MPILNSIKPTHKSVVNVLYVIGFILFLVMYWFNNEPIPHTTEIVQLRSLFSTDYGYFNTPVFGTIFVNLFILYEYLSNKIILVRYYRTSRLKAFQTYTNHLLRDSVLFGGLYILIGVTLNEFSVGRLITNIPLNLLTVITLATTVIFLMIVGSLYRLTSSIYTSHSGLMLTIFFNTTINLIAPKLKIWHPLSEVNFYSSFFHNELTIINIFSTICRLLLVLIVTLIITNYCVHREDIL